MFYRLLNSKEFQKIKPAVPLASSLPFNFHSFALILSNFSLSFYFSRHPVFSLLSLCFHFPLLFLSFSHTHLLFPFPFLSFSITIIVPPPLLFSFAFALFFFLLFNHHFTNNKSGENQGRHHLYFNYFKCSLMNN